MYALSGLCYVDQIKSWRFVVWDLGFVLNFKVSSEISQWLMCQVVIANILFKLCEVIIQIHWVCIWSCMLHSAWSLTIWRPASNKCIVTELKLKFYIDNFIVHVPVWTLQSLSVHISLHLNGLKYYSRTLLSGLLNTQATVIIYDMCNTGHILKSCWSQRDLGTITTVHRVTSNAKV